LADDQAIRFPKGSKVWNDTGFQGCEPEGVTTFQPMMKPKGKELSAEQKQKTKNDLESALVLSSALAASKFFALFIMFFVISGQGLMTW